MAHKATGSLVAGVFFALAAQQSPGAAISFTDGFNGSLRPEWRWLDEDGSAWNLNNGRLNVRRYPGNGFYGNVRVPVLHYPSVPFESGVVAQVKVGFDVDRKYGQAGLVVYYNNDTYAKYVLEYWWEYGLRVIFLEEIDGVKQSGNVVSGSDNQVHDRIEVELKLAIENGNFRTWFRRVGDANWTDGCISRPLPSRGAVNIGLFSQADMGSSDWAWFDDFSLYAPNGGTTPPPPPPPATQSPYSGSPAGLPGTIQAEDLDNGGEGVAYHDNDASNNGGQYRTTGVDIESQGEGPNVGWTNAGEWLEYTVSVAQAGTYDLDLRVASQPGGGAVHVEFDGVNKTGTINVGATGGWGIWSTVSKTGLSLSAGQQVMRVYVDNAGFNLNWVKLALAGSTPVLPPPPPPPPPSSQTPYSGSPAAIPGTVQAEDFDNGGEAVAYHDNDAANTGGQYRSTGVDIENQGEGPNVGWMNAGEWLEYTVNVAAAGAYTLDLRVASLPGGGALHVEFDGVNKSGTVGIGATGGWGTWTTVSKTGLNLTAGQQVMRVYVDNSGFNLNWVKLTASGVPPPLPPPPPSGQTPYSGSPAALPGTVQAEDFDNGGEGVAYHDDGSGNTGGLYRTSDVDIESQGEGPNVGWMNAGEWLEYTVNVASAGTYTLEFRVASSPGNAALRVEFDGVSATGTVNIGPTGGWSAWTTLSKTGVNLTAGQKVMRVYVEKSGLNLNWVKATLTGGTPKELAPACLAPMPVAVAGRQVLLPAGMRGVTLVDLTGRQVWSYERSSGAGAAVVDLPQSVINHRGRLLKRFY